MIFGDYPNILGYSNIAGYYDLATASGGALSACSRGHSLLCENREQPEESLTLMLQDQTRFTGRQRQTNLPLSDPYA